MRKLELVLMAACFVWIFASQSHGAEITVKVSDQDQQAFSNLPGAVDQCVAGLQLRGDAAVCKLIAGFASEFGAKVKAAAPPATDADKK